MLSHPSAGLPPDREEMCKLLWTQNEMYKWLRGRQDRVFAKRLTNACSFLGVWDVWENKVGLSIVIVKWNDNISIQDFEDYLFKKRFIDYYDTSI